MQTQQTDGHMMTIRELEDEAAGAACFDVRVLLTGERGVGKQTLARLIHERSRGSAAPFVIVDCAEVSDAEFELEWLGNLTDSPGAPANATHTWLKRAEGGTIFIRSFERMTQRKQSALFRYLDARHVAPPRGVANSPSEDVRLVVAGCTTLLDAVNTGRFRADLFYRINTVHIPVAPLCERPQDVPVLVGRFMRSIAGEQGRSAPLVSTEAMRRLMAYSWPDNVRELKAVAEQLMMQEAAVIDTRSLPPQILQETADTARRRGMTPVPPQFGRVPRNIARSQ